MDSNVTTYKNYNKVYRECKRQKKIRTYDQFAASSSRTVWEKLDETNFNQY